MPSTHSAARGSLRRRRLLGAVGTALAGSLAGCDGRIPGTGPTRIDAESTVEDDRIVWRYPPRPDDGDGIGYAAVEAEPRARPGGAPPVLRLEFNSTVGGVAASEPYGGYRPDWFRFRVWPPTAYGGRLQYEVRVGPPGQWEEFSAYYDIRGGVRQFTAELRDVETRGTVLVPAVFDPGVDSLPRRLHCSVAVQVSRPGLTGETVRISGRETLDLEEA
jgi:hypothetical protein